MGIPVIVADTEEEAQRIAEGYRIVRIHLKSGRTITVGNVEHAEEYGRQAEEEYTIEERQAYVVHGSKTKVREQLLEAQRKYGVEEFIVISTIRNAVERLRSYELLIEAFSEEEALRETSRIREISAPRSL